MTISIVINMIFSAVFFTAMFGFAAPVPIDGPHGFGADFIPQSFMVALMGSLVPAMLTRARLGMQFPSAGRVVLASIMAAAISALIAGGGGWTVARATGWHELAPRLALLIKLLFAAILSAIVTPVALRRLLRAHLAANQSGRPT